MDIQAASRDNITYILRAVSGAKALLLDPETTEYTSLVYTQSEMVLKDVYLMDLLENFSDREPLTDLSCLILVRGTHRNISLIAKELSESPCFGSYYIYFTSPVSHRDIEVLAKSDSSFLVKDVRELFGDLYAVKPNLFTVKMPPFSIGGRVVNGIIAALGSLKKIPSEVRYQANSASCSKLVERLVSDINSNTDIFQGKQCAGGQKCSILIIDRTEDPFTPLLMPWTYEAMIHEFLQFDLNAIVLDKSKAGASKDPEENQYVFNARHDEFYAKHMYSDWGNVCVEAQGMVEDYQSSVKSTTEKPAEESTDAVDLRDRISQLPKIKQKAVTMKKHVDVMTEIGKDIRSRNLFDMGALEQDIMRTYAPRDHWRKLREIVESKTSTNSRDILRLALIFILRYESEDGNSLTSETSGFTKAFTNLNVTGSSDDASQKVTTAAVVLELLHANEIGRSTSLIKIKHFLDRYGSDARCMNQPSKSSRNIFKSVFGVVKGASVDQNQQWYTQHKPFVTVLAKMLLEDNLSSNDFPTYPTNLTIDEKVLEKSNSPNILIFFVGGVTYTEVRVMEEFCAEYTDKVSEKSSSKKSPSKHAPAAPNILLGSTNVLTSGALLDQMLNE